MMKKLAVILAVAFFPVISYSQNIKIVDINARHQLFKGVTGKLFNAAINSDVAAYNGRMQEITPEDIKLMGRRETLVAVYPDPNDPYYSYDSLIVEEFRPENVDGYMFWVDTTNAAAEFPAIDTPAAIGIYYDISEKDSEGNKVELKQDLFWVKWNDAMQLMNMQERKYLMNLYQLQQGVER